jgi:hypothetical protein
VPKPKEHLGAMPPMGGAELAQPEIAALAAYVWAIGQGEFVLHLSVAQKLLFKFDGLRFVRKS